MGLKIRLGMAGIGLFMSYFFGLSGLSGIATHLDSTGNILVDIADGIELVSKVKTIIIFLSFSTFLLPPACTVRQKSEFLLQNL